MKHSGHPEPKYEGNDLLELPAFQLNPSGGGNAQKCPYEELEVKSTGECTHTYAALLASDAAYENKTQIDTFLRKNRHLPFAEFFRVLSLTDEYAVFKLQGQSSTLVAFRGTADFQDVLADIDVRQTSAFEGGVHAGFLKRAKAVDIQPLAELLKADARTRLILTGHSLSGAVAAVVTLRLLRESNLMPEHLSRVKCITFGQPLIGDEDLLKSVMKNQDEWRHFSAIVNEMDVVPRILMMKEEATQAFGKGLKTVAFWTKPRIMLHQKLKPCHGMHN
jgi:hypothetical protein